MTNKLLIIKNETNKSLSRSIRPSHSVPNNGTKFIANIQPLFTNTVFNGILNKPSSTSSTRNQIKQNFAQELSKIDAFSGVAIAMGLWQLPGVTEY